MTRSMRSILGTGTELRIVSAVCQVWAGPRTHPVRGPFSFNPSSSIDARHHWPDENERCRKVARGGDCHSIISEHRSSLARAAPAASPRKASLRGQRRSSPGTTQRPSRIRASWPASPTSAGSTCSYSKYGGVPWRGTAPLKPWIGLLPVSQNQSRINFAKQEGASA